MADVFTFGESMVVFQALQIGNLEDFQQIQQKIGGAESNFATGLARLGHQVSYMSKVGNDPFGRRILKSIRSEGIDTTYLKIVEEAPTGLLFKEQKFKDAMNVYYYRKDSAASLMTEDDLPVEIFKELKYLHITGITPALSASCRALVFRAIELAQQHNVKVIFDPNIRFKLWDRQEAYSVLNAIAEKADYILAGMEEAVFLTKQEEIDVICRKLKRRDNQVIIIKRGEASTVIYEQGQFEEVPTISVDHILDPVGAGDAFAAGFVHGLLQNYSLKECVRYGNHLGARVIKQYGDVEGLPLLHELQEELANEGKADVIR